MRVDVLLFGPLAAAAGGDRVAIDCEIEDADAGPTAAAVLAALGTQHPVLASGLSGARLAVNRTFASPEVVIGPRDEIALIALVGGG